MAGPEGISANALSKEVGISQPSLSRWLREAGRIPGMSNPPKQEKSPHRWSAEERWRVILEASSLSDDELGAFLRRKGLHVSQLEEWRKSAMESLAVQKSKRRVMSKEMKRIRELEKELRRKDKALAEVSGTRRQRYCRRADENAFTWFTLDAAARSSRQYRSA